MRHRLVVFVMMWCAAAGVWSTQTAWPVSGEPVLWAAVLQQPAEETLTIGGDVSAPFTVNAADFQKLPHIAITVTESGAAVQYEGVAVATLLKQAGAATGGDLRGPALAHYIVAEGGDGYRAIFGITEGDPEFTDRPIVVADRRNGEPLSRIQGPFRLIATADKRPTRSVRNVVGIQLRRVN